MKQSYSWLELANMPLCCMCCGSRDVDTTTDTCLACGQTKEQIKNTRRDND